MSNCSYFISRSGILKFLSVLMGIVSSGAGLYGYIESEHNKYCEDYLEEFPHNGTIFAESKLDNDTIEVYCDLLWMERWSLYGITGITLISIIFIIVSVLSSTICNSKYGNVIDFAFHLTGAILLIVCGIFMGFSAMEIDDKICKDNTECQLFYEKIGSAGSAILNGILFVAITLSVNRIRFQEKLFEQV